MVGIGGGFVMRTVLIISVFAGICVAGRFASTQEPAKKSASAQQLSSVSERLVGAWRLISVETKRGNGEVIYPFYGKHPQGLLIYDRSGWMSVQIVSDPNPAVPTASSREGFLKATPAEKRKRSMASMLITELGRSTSLVRVSLTTYGNRCTQVNAE